MFSRIIFVSKMCQKCWVGQGRAVYSLGTVLRPEDGLGRQLAGTAGRATQLILALTTSEKSGNE